MSLPVTDRHDAWAYRAAEIAVQPRGGPLAGLPFGVKDIIDVAGMPTGLGLDDRPARVAERDAWCVALLRAAGGVPVGKTRTTPLASIDPAPTRHPHDPARTPGGSSAGSAAAVAAGDVPLALGTQTFGSVVRPAAYCGVVGFKPTYGRVATVGVHPLAPSCDTVGVIAHDVATAVAAVGAWFPLARRAAGGPLRLAYAGDALCERFAPATLAALDRWVATVPIAVAQVTRVALDALAPMLPLAQTIQAFEAHAMLRHYRDAGALPPEVDALIERGAAIDGGRYRAALVERDALRARTLAAIAGFDAVLLPLADEAPTRETTGDALPQAPWTAWGCPTATLPVTRSAAGLSLSIGVVAVPGADATVLDVLAALEPLSTAA